MGEAAFILLKGRRAGPESAKHVEISLANLLKILAIPAAGRKTAGQDRGRHVEVVSAHFRWIWLMVRNLALCELDHNVCCATEAVSCTKMQEKVDATIGFDLYSLIYIR
jgi:hypothetical protein